MLCMKGLYSYDRHPRKKLRSVYECVRSLRVFVYVHECVRVFVYQHTDCRSLSTNLKHLQQSCSSIKEPVDLISGYSRVKKAIYINMSLQMLQSMTCPIFPLFAYWLLRQHPGVYLLLSLERLISGARTSLTYDVKMT